VTSPNISTPKKVDLAKVTIGPLDPQTDRAAFCCGHDKINNFCRNNAKKQNAVNRVRVYDAHYEGELIGYYYLVASTHLPDVLSKEAAEKFGRVHKAPCIYLGMIGVRTDCKKNGVGKLLMLHAMQNTMRVADIVGVYALTLHADDDVLAAQYKRWGFESFIEDGDGERAMYMPLGTLRDALEPAGAQQVAVVTVP
jgi:GNAT superfamily N-acetyltransferase